MMAHQKVEMMVSNWVEPKVALRETWMVVKKGLQRDRWLAEL